MPTERPTLTLADFNGRAGLVLDALQRMGNGSLVIPPAVRAQAVAYLSAHLCTAYSEGGETVLRGMEEVRRSLHVDAPKPPPTIKQRLVAILGKGGWRGGD